jgi:hypothetical protein
MTDDQLNELYWKLHGIIRLGHHGSEEEAKSLLRSALNPPDGCVRLPDGRDVAYSGTMTDDDGHVAAILFSRTEADRAKGGE